MTDQRRDDRDPECGGITCEEAVERVYEFLDGELDPGWMERVREHAEICRRCTPHFEFERVFLEHVRRKGLRPERSELLEKRIREALESE